MKNEKINRKNVPEFIPPDPKFIERIRKNKDSITEEELNSVEQLRRFYFINSYEDYIYEINFSKNSKLQEIQSYSLSTPVFKFQDHQKFNYLNLSHLYSHIYSITFPPSLENMDSYCLGKCDYLTQITFLKDDNDNNFLFNINSNAMNDTKIESISIPPNIKYIGSQCFPKTLKTIEFEKGCPKLKQIDKYAFSNTQIEKFSVPLNVDPFYNSQNFFFNCKNLKTIIFDQFINKEDEINYEEEDDTDDLCQNFLLSQAPIQNLEIFSSNIKKFSFYNTKNLISITVPKGKSCRYIKSKGILYTKNKKKLIVAERNIKRVTVSSKCASIENFAFNFKSLEKVSFENNSELNRISMFAFSESKIRKINIPDSVQKIGCGTFYNCRKLESINISKNLQLFEDFTFSYTKLAEIKIPKSVKRIQLGCFCNCNNLISVLFDEDSQLTEINDYAFAGTNIVSILIPKCVMSIGDSCFFNCNKMKSIQFEENSVLKCLGNDCFNGTKIEEIQLPSTVKECHFSDTRIKNISIEAPGSLEFVCDLISLQITEFSVPASVMKISSFAFFDCANLSVVKVIDIENSKLKAIEKGAFLNCKSLKEFQIPKSVNSICKDAFKNCSNYKVQVSLYSKSETIFIESNAFFNTRITSFTSKSKSVSIGDSAFQDCKHLKIFSSKATEFYSFGCCSFMNCRSLSVFKIYQETKKITIEDNCFNNTSIKEFICPNVLTKIPDFCFKCCTKLTHFEIKEESEIEIFGKESFYKTAIESIFIPKKTSAIGESCFQNCKELKGITFSEQMNNKLYLYEKSFSSSGIEKIHFQDGILFISYACFRNCINLKSVTFSEKTIIYDLGESAFESTCIESINIPLFVTFNHDFNNVFIFMSQKALVQKNTFKNCKQLRKVKFNSDAVMIENYAFKNCINLQEISFTNSLLVEILQTEKWCPKFILFQKNQQINESYIKMFMTRNEPPFSYYHSFDFKNSMLLNKNCHLDLCFSSFCENVFLFVDPTTSKEKIKFRTIEQKDGCSFLECGKKLFCCDFSTVEANIPKETEIIKSNAFKFSNLKKIEFEKESKLQKIKNFVFESLLIEEISIPDSVTSIGDSAFRDCFKLKKVNINETSQLTLIGKSAFEKTSIESICFPSKLKIVDDLAFFECLNLTKVDNHSNKIEFHYKSFYRSSIETINFPSKSSFLNSSFKECLKLKNLSFLNKPTKLLFEEESFAFSGLEELKLECDKIEIQQNAFIFCSLLKQVQIKGKSTKCCNNAFAKTKLDSCVLSAKVPLNSEQNIIDDVFCSQIEKVSLALKIQSEHDQKTIIKKYFLNHKCYVVDNVLEYANLIDNQSLFEKNPPGKKVQLKKNEILRVPSNVKKFNFPVMSHIQKIQWAPNCNVEDLGHDGFFSYYNLTEITIPKLVKKISPFLFENCHFLRVVQFECDSKLEEIGDYAFANTRINKINLPETVKIIGKCSFFNIFELKEVSFNGEIIGKYAFSQTGIQEFTLSNNIKSIDKGAFQYCHSLTKLNIDIENSNLFELGSYSFSETSITEMNIPESLVKLGDFVFDGCQLLKEVIFSMNSKLEFIGENPFNGNLSLKLIKIPSSISSLFDHSKLTQNLPFFVKDEINKDEYVDEFFVENCCFISTREEEQNGNIYVEKGCYIVDHELKYVHLFDNSLLYEKQGKNDEIKENEILKVPSDVKKLNFNLSTHIKKIQWEPNCIVEDLGPDRFFSYCNLTEIMIPKLVKKISPYLFDHCHFLRNVFFEKDSELIEIGDFGFANTSIESIILPESVQIIGKSAFLNDFKLKEISFEGKIIGEEAFSGSGIVSFNLSNKTKSIGKSAFRFCRSLKQFNVDLENSNLKEIGSFAFSESSIDEFNFPPKVKIIKESTFEGCQSLKRVFFPATSKLTKIEDYSFSHNISLETINIPKTTKRISFTSFINTPSLKYIMNKPSQYFKVMRNFTVYGRDGSLIFVPRNFEKFKVSRNCFVIHSGAFCGSSIEKVAFSDNSLICIEKCAFAHSVALNKIHLPNSLRVIGEEAFINCQNLESIEFEPMTKLKEIPRFCFAFCGLKTVKLPISVEVIKNSAFYFCQNLKMVNLEKTNLRFIGDLAFCEDNLTNIKLPSTIKFVGSNAFGSNKSINLIDFSKVNKIKETNQLPIISFIKRAKKSNSRLSRAIKKFIKKQIQEIKQKTDEDSIENDSQSKVSPQISQNMISKKKPSIVKPTSSRPTSSHVSSQSKSRNNESVFPVLPPLPADEHEKAPRKKNKEESNDKIVKFSYKEKVDEDDLIVQKNSPCFVHELAFSKSSVKQFNFDLQEFKWFSFFDDCNGIDEFTVNEYMTIYLHKLINEKPIRGSLTGQYFKVKRIESQDNYSIAMAKEPFKHRRIINPFNFLDFSKLTKIEIGNEIDIDEVPKFCFAYSPLKEITIPSSVCSIRSCAFYSCRNLCKVLFSKESELTAIFESAFFGCQKLDSIIIPAGVKSIPKKCFAASGLKSIKLPESVQFVDSMAFYGCEKLSEITFNKKIQEIGEFSFANNHSLESIDLPDSLKIIKSCSFSNCSNLKEVKTTENTCLIEIHNGSFENTQIEQIGVSCKAKILFEPICVPKLNKITFYQGLPKHFIQLEDGSIYERIQNSKENQNLNENEDECKNKNIKQLIDNIYDNCKGNSCSKEIKEIIFSSINDHSALNLLFAPKNLDILKIEKNCLSMSKAVINNMTNLQKIEYSEGGFSYVMNFPYFNHLFSAKIKEIKILGNESFFEENVFSYFNSIEFVEFGEKTKLLYIPKFCFLNCSNLRQIKIPSSCYSIDECAFKNCEKLEIVEFGQINTEKNLKYIGKAAFFNCSSLNSVILPSSVEMICEESFMNCTNLKKVIFDNIEESQLSIIKKNAFKNCRSLESFILPSNCTLLGPACFSDCTSLESFECEGTNLSTIQCRSFMNCSSLLKFVLRKTKNEKEEQNLKIMQEAFMNCTSLNEVSFEDGSQNCETIEKVTQKINKNEEEKIEVPISKYSFVDDVKYQEIGKKAFCNCKSLTKARFFIRNLQCFDENAFENCSSLKTIELNSSYWKQIMTINMKRNSFVGTNEDLEIKVFNKNEFINISFKVDNKPAKPSEKRHFKHHLSSSLIFNDNQNDKNEKIIEKKIGRFNILFYVADKREDEDKIGKKKEFNDYLQKFNKKSINEKFTEKVEQPSNLSEKAEYRIDKITKKRHYKQYSSSLNKSLISWFTPEKSSD